MIVMDWAAKLFALSPDFYNTSGVGGGVIQVNLHFIYFKRQFEFSCNVETTASDSALVAVVAARSRYLRQHPSIPMENLVIYTTTQTHSLGKKAGLVLGLSTRAIPVDPVDDFALRGTELNRAIEEDLKNGKKPFILSMSFLVLL